MIACQWARAYLSSIPCRKRSAPVIELLEKVEVATISHVLHSGFVDPELRDVLPGKRVAGTAVTLRIPNAHSTSSTT